MAPSADPARPILRRSALFVPSGRERFYPRAASAGADLIVLDLEDAVAAPAKSRARGSLAEALATLRPTRCAVRINVDEDLLTADMAACAELRVSELVVPKVSSAADVLRVRSNIGAGWEPRLSLLVESLQGVQDLRSILAAPPVAASVALGMEDLRSELVLGAPGSSGGSQLEWLHGPLLIAAGASGVSPVGLVGDIVNFTDLDAFKAATRRAWLMGYRGTYCVHPAQVAVANGAYSPGDDDVRWATEVVGAAEDAFEEGVGSFTVRGQMVDAPLVARARRILDYHRDVEVAGGPREGADSDGAG